MPNVGGPKQGSRALLATVVHSLSVLLYGSPLWGATLLLAVIAPVWLLAKERANMWETQQREDVTATRLDIKGEAHAALLQEWQGEWDAYPKGRWTQTY